MLRVKRRSLKPGRLLQCNISQKLLTEWAAERGLQLEPSLKWGGGWALYDNHDDCSYHRTLTDVAVEIHRLDGKNPQATLDSCQLPSYPKRRRRRSKTWNTL